MKKIEKFAIDFAGRKIEVETGRLAHQTNAAVTVRYGDTEVLATVVSPKQKREGMDYFPLTVDYEERFYAAGKISGSRFIKREGRPSEEAILTSRMIDRPLRPLFPKGYMFDVQVVVTVLSYDQENGTKFPALLAASIALSISDIPWNGPLGLAQIGLINGELVLNPSEPQLANSDLDLVVVSSDKKVVMIEAGGKQVPQEKVVEAIELAHNSIQPIIAFQKDIISKIGLAKREFDDEYDAALYEEVKTKYAADLATLFTLKEKLERESLFNATVKKIKEDYVNKQESSYAAAMNENVKAKKAAEYFDLAFREIMRKNIMEKGERVDGRALNEVRSISGEVAVLPRVHGSAIFNRGYTQILNVVTLGSTGMKQILDTMEEDDTKKRYMHHYNFPPYSTGEARPSRSPGRREIGHGALAEKALFNVLPTEESFPYTMRLVSECMSSDGSTSMGSTCASTLSLMDAGVPIIAPVSGIAMGIITDENDNYKVLTDIAGTEDHNGDMDFKIAGSVNGITAIQLDVKNLGLTIPMIKDTFTQGFQGRMFILEQMLKAIDKPRADLSPFAPRIETIMINPDKIRDVIGPGGKVINKIIDDTGVEIDIEQDGRVNICAVNKEAIEKAKAIIEGLTADPEVGKIYKGKVIKIMDFGAFVEIMPGKEGLVHISEISDSRVDKVTDVLKEGQEVTVVLKEIDSMGRLNLSMKRVGK
ncbi:MAG TPA: polyribonucleotide nucleotidyltransferase [Patescibacteria group bacterium]|nr:polyribonucleotide nucleotidyltransferase [Patescibacteria group bacterium]